MTPPPPQEEKKCCKKCCDPELTGHDTCAFSHCDCHTQVTPTETWESRFSARFCPDGETWINANPLHIKNFIHQEIESALKKQQNSGKTMYQIGYQEAIQECLGKIENVHDKVMQQCSDNDCNFCVSDTVMTNKIEESIKSLLK